jgi:hypothetical protein
MRWVNLVPALALVGAGVACSDGSGPPEGMSRARVLLTDAPFPFDAVKRVDVYIVSVAAATTADTSGGAEWITIAEPRARFDLLALQGGQATLIGEGDLPAAQYAAVRLVIDVDSSSVTLADGTPAVVDWQGSGEKTLYALVEQPLALFTPGTEMEVVLDFDVGRSFLPAYGFALNDLQFLFIPWIRAVNEAGTGVVAGTIMGANAPSEVLGPVPTASITVYRYMTSDFGPRLAYAASTGRTDAQGHYAIHYLAAGDYVVEAYPPGGFNAGVAYSVPITVTMGETTHLDLTLPQSGSGGAALFVYGPSLVALHDTVSYFATVLGGAGDSLPAPAVSWFSRDPAVATITGSNNSARLVAAALGTTWVVATFEGLADSLAVTVAESDSTGGGGNTNPVATVALTPAAQTVAVGDSAGFWATLRDAQGAMLSGRTIAWAATDTTVARFEFVWGQAVILRALKHGTITVTATSEGKSGSGTVTVQ